MGRRVLSCWRGLAREEFAQRVRLADMLRWDERRFGSPLLVGATSDCLLSLGRMFVRISWVVEFCWAVS